MFKKILIANRGEIAVRVIKACRELGIKAAVIYSEVDRTSLHVQWADEAYLVGPAPPRESYLNIERIIEIAHKAKAEAIHPGYGFLAENPEFSRRCEEEGIIFIGPNSKALQLVGDKITARSTMEAAGIPIIPGMKKVGHSYDDYANEARKLGYPVMIKASAGGGGKGMRVIYREEDLKSALEAGMREALAAFGDESVYLEKYIEEPRHIEFQVLADNYGNIVHLFERECSIQRRHQKIVEETPSLALTPELRQKMGETAKKVLKVAGYNNAGTVEFLLDKNKNFYFLEVNARLQVEHPITELTTGIDLVHQQIKIAAGEKLSFKQEEIKQKGHAIECRIYAEDPAKGFLPSSGKILYLQEPRGPGIRVDSGVYLGWDVPIYYDPILAKLIVWAENRAMACYRMTAALKDYVILGIATTIPFLREIIGHPEFLAGRTTTSFIAQYFAPWTEIIKETELRRLAQAAAAYMEINQRPAFKAERVSQPTRFSPWQSLGPWRIGGGD
ncbi:MAG: acetyl-CoA carboxylase biotin carboxylase subunit [Candidatus Aminicenantes bacterium]|nr:acetyl-CoA carboxylase biotin carboxylase subunit [Candidatus Aminicenantes bacterium]